MIRDAFVHQITQHVLTNSPPRAAEVEDPFPYASFSFAEVLDRGSSVFNLYYNILQLSSRVSSVYTDCFPDTLQ